MEPKLNLDILPPEVVTEFLLRLSPKDLANYCQTSKRASEFCKDNAFWKDKYRFDFGPSIPKNPTKSWIDLYKQRAAFKNSPISAGSAHYAIIDDQGILYMGGDNSLYQLGNGTTNNSNVPIPVTFFNQKIISVSCGFGFTVAITENGKIYRWGSILSISTGTYYTLQVPTLIESLKNYSAVKVSCGEHGWGVILNNGSIYYSILVGNSQIEGIYPFGEEVIDISAHSFRIGIVTGKGNLYFFGGRPGSTSTGMRKVDGDWVIGPLRVPFPPGELIKQVSISGTYIMALSTNGNIFSWGNNYFGQLGLETKKGATHRGEYTSPHKVIVSTAFMIPVNFSYIGTYDTMSYGITVSGRLYIWGGNHPIINHLVTIHGSVWIPHISVTDLTIKSPMEMDIGLSVNYFAFGSTFSIAVTKDRVFNYMRFTPH